MEATPRAGPAPESGQARRKASPPLLVQFVLIPLVIVSIGVAVFILFGLIAQEARSPREYLREIRGGTANRRWQAAYELSRELRRAGSRADSELVPEIVSTLEWARSEDPQIRRYLARALGFLGDRRAVPALIASLSDGDADTRLWAAEALGAIADPAAVDSVASLLADEDADVRKQAAYSLGAFAEARAVEPLRGALADRVEDVRWNAALALARLGDRSGAPVLLQMIDRDHLHQVPGIRPDQQEIAIVSALSALGALRVDEARDPMARLSREDSSLRVRQAALQALERFDNHDAGS